MTKYRRVGLTAAVVATTAALICASALRAQPGDDAPYPRTVSVSGPNHLPPPAPALRPLGAPPPPQPPTIPEPIPWLRAPNHAEMASVYPPRALAQYAGGHSIMRCLVVAGGRLSDCRVLSEDPADLGFGLATLKLAPIFRVRARTDDGAPTEGGSVVVRVHWVLPKPPTP